MRNRNIRRDPSTTQAHLILRCYITKLLLLYRTCTKCLISILFTKPGRVAQSVGHLTRKSGVLGSIPGLATYFRFSFAFSRRTVVSYWRKYVHEVLVNRLGGLSLPRKSVVRLTDRPDMTIDVYRGRKTTIQQQQIYSPINRINGLSV